MYFDFFEQFHSNLELCACHPSEVSVCYPGVTVVLKCRPILPVHVCFKLLAAQCVSVSVYVFQPESDLTIIQLEKRLRLHVETMTNEKQERLKMMKARMKVDQQLCDVLNAIPYYIPTGSVPTDQQLDELEQHIRDLESEQVANQCRLVQCFTVLPIV